MDFKACPRNLWKSLQLVHVNREIHSVSTKLVDFSALGTVFIALILHSKKRTEIIQTNLLNVKRLSQSQTCLVVLDRTISVLFILKKGLSTYRAHWSVQG